MSRETTFQNRRFSTFQEHTRLDSLESVTGVSWNIFTVSRLFNYDVSESKLKSLAKKLREMVAGTLYSNMDVPQIVEEYKATIKCKEGISMTNFEEEALCIQVKKIPAEGTGLVEKQLYIGYLMSRGRSSVSEAEFPQLPLLLCRGYVKVIKCVHEALEKFFDCSISSYSLAQKDLFWILAILLHTPDDLRGEGQIALKFSAPLATDKNFFTFEIPSSELCNLWSGIHKTDDPEVTGHEVKQLMKVLMSHILVSYNFDLNALLLRSIHLPSAVISPGKLLMNTLESAGVILRFITVNTLLMEKLNPPAFDMKSLGM